MGISTHILDTAAGRPAAGVPVTLALMTGGEWTTLNAAVTDADGRCKYLLPEGQALQPGVYRVQFRDSVLLCGAAACRDFTRMWRSSSRSSTTGSALPHTVATDRQRLHHLSRKLMAIEVELAENRYGKSRVRLMKVTWHARRQSICANGRCRCCCRATSIPRTSTATIARFLRPTR